MENTNANDNSISESNVNSNVNRDGGWTTSSGQSVSDLMSETAGMMDRWASEGHDSDLDFNIKDGSSNASVTAPEQTQVEQVQPKPMDLSYIDIEIERSSSPTEMQVEAAPVAQPIEDEEEEKSDVLNNFLEKYRKKITTDLNATPEEHQAAKDQQTEDDVRANEIREPAHFKIRTPVPSSGVRGMLEEEAKDAPQYAQAAESDIFGDDDPFAGFTTNKPKKTDVEELERTATAADEYKAASDKAIEAGNTFVSNPSNDTYKEFYDATENFTNVAQKYVDDKTVSDAIDSKMREENAETFFEWYKQQDKLQDLIDKYSKGEIEDEDAATDTETAMDERLQAQREFEESTGLTSIDDVDTVLNSDEYTDEQKAAAQKLKDALAKEDSSFTSAGTLDGYDEKRDTEIDKEAESLMEEGKVTEGLNKLEEKHTISFETPRYEVPTEDGGTKTVTTSEATSELAKRWEKLRKSKYNPNDESLTYEKNSIAWTALEDVARASATGNAILDLLNDETTVSNEEMGTTASTFASDVSTFFKEPSVAHLKTAVESLKNLMSKAKSSQAGKIVAVVKGFVSDTFTALAAGLGGISAAAIKALAQWIYNLTKSELNTKDDTIDNAVIEALHESSGHDDFDINVSSTDSGTSDDIKFDRLTSDASNVSTKEYNWGLKASDVNVKYIYTKSPTIRKFVKNIGR